MNYFVTADMHFGHGNIIDFCNRPYKNSDEMNYMLIRNWNERVKDEDTVIHVGDFYFNGNRRTFQNGDKENAQYFANQLNGTIIFIKGNHDNNNGVNAIIESMKIKFGGIDINLVHKPEHANTDYSLNIVGHVHEKWNVLRYNEKDLMINCGVDVWNYRPVKLQEIISLYTLLRSNKNRDVYNSLSKFKDYMMNR